jgi:hypothetical protein
MLLSEPSSRPHCLAADDRGAATFSHLVHGAGYVAVGTGALSFGGFVAEGAAWLERALALPGGDRPTAGRRILLERSLADLREPGPRFEFRRRLPELRLQNFQQASRWELLKDRAIPTAGWVTSVRSAAA